MASALSNWYHNQYSSWNRTRRLQAAPFMARTDSQTARVAQTAASRLQTTDTIINMGDLLETPAHAKKQDTLFGPSIGIVDPGPSWTDHQQNEKPPLQDILTPELVKSWIEKSKEASQPTTTLQALVNLKRPSLKLAPISHGDDADDVPLHHGLEFQFDCDAPKCGISLHVAVQDVSSSPPSSSPRLVNLFNTVVEGGFGRVLKLEEGAILELDKYDPHAATTPPSDLQASSTSAKSAAPSSSSTDPTPAPAAQEEQHHPRKRFTLRIRRRTHPHAAEDRNQVSVAGPALQVVDMEGSHPSGTDATTGKDHKDETGGVKVMIQLEALDEHEHGFASVNSQTTYLHIVRVGPPPATPDTRPWVVRVVKREATIGPHTFHLHEIYGLTSHTSAHPPSHADPQSHTYPPSTQPIDDDPTSECLLCLSSPREVVLLPCRHLVACKECAMNMVEFGAGGQLVHNEEPPAAGASAPADPVPGESAGEGSGAGPAGSGGDDEGAAPAAAPAAPPATRSRRKRKPKGWFCPVCRQPYTSLLRISTTAPVKAMEGGEVAPPATPQQATTGATPPARTGLLAAIRTP